MEHTARPRPHPRTAGIGLLLAGVALAAAACTGDALAAGEPVASGPVSSLPAATPLPTRTPTPTPTQPSAAELAQHATAYVLEVQAYAQDDDNTALPRHVCTATFSEFEFIAPRQALYASNSTLTDFVTATSAIGWACELRRVAQIRAGVQSLDALAPALAALGG